LLLVLLIGIPLLGVLYFFDQYRTPGPSLIERDIQVAEDAVNRTRPDRFLALAQAPRTAGSPTRSRDDQILAASPDAAGRLAGDRRDRPRPARCGRGRFPEDR
jgi:hypothetical protein